MVSTATLLLAIAQVGAALKVGVSLHSGPAASGKMGSVASTQWVDSAYSELGKDHDEKTKPSAWEKDFMESEWDGNPNKLLAATLNSPETVPNDSNLGIITPGLNAKAEKYNQLMAAYDKDFVTTDDNDLFKFSSHRTSDWAIKASAAEEIRSRKDMSVETEEAVQDLEPDQISMIPPSDTKALERLLTGGIGHPWRIPDSSSASPMTNTKSPWWRRIVRRAELKAGIKPSTAPVNSLRAALLKASATSLADPAGAAVAGVADGDENSMLQCRPLQHMGP
jgi:hypothetical protein